MAALSGVLGRAGSAGLVVVGAGIAGLRVAQGVRREAYVGPVTLLGAEAHLPYDRPPPPLSKQVLTGELTTDPAVYHEAAYFDEIGVSVRTGTRVRRIDLTSRTLTIDAASASGPAPSRVESLAFDAVVIATGARARRLPCATPPKGVHVVRTVEDAAALASELRVAQRVVVVGAGFIGAEVASSAKSLGAEVTVVEAAASPMVRAIGSTAAQLLSGLHRLNGVTLRCGVGVTGMVGDDQVRGVILDDGSAVAADLVVIGVGVVPDVDWLADSGLPLGDGLECDEFLCAHDDFVFGAGDAVSWPNPAMEGVRMRSQQWTTAGNQGTHVARVLVRGAEAAGPFGHDMAASHSEAEGSFSTV